MNIPANWDNTPVNDGSFEQMTVGGHICKIVGVKLGQSRNNREMLIIALEVIDEGPLNEFYSKRFAERKKYHKIGDPEPKWPCIYYQLTTDANGNASSYFKGLIKALENSNEGYKWDWNESGMKGLKLGFVFGEEEYRNNMGEIRTSVKPVFPRSIDKILDGVQTPPKKFLNESMQAASRFTPIEDDEIPF